MPDFVVITGESGAGKSSILEAITYLKERVIKPDRQPNTCTSSISQCHELVYNNSNTCKISAKFELSQSEMVFLRRKYGCDATSLIHNAYIRLNKDGQIIEHKCSDGLRALLKFYNKYNDRSNIARFDRIGPFKTFYPVESDTINKVGDLRSRSKGIFPIEEKLARVKENFVFAKAEAFDHIQNMFDKNMQVTKEDVFENLKTNSKTFQ